MSLSTAKPRNVSAWSRRSPVIVFTDGAYEEERQVVTHGAVLYDPKCGEHLLCLEIVCRLSGSIDGGHRVRNTLYVRVRFFHYWWRSRLGRIFALPELCFGLWIRTRPWAELVQPCDVELSSDTFSLVRIRVKFEAIFIALLFP